MKQEISENQKILYSFNNFKKKKNNKTLLITTPGSLKRSYLNKILDKDISPEIFLVKRYPDFDLINEILSCYKGIKFDLIISLGGGSVIDLSKIYSLNFNLYPKIKNINDLNADSKEKILNYSIPTTAGSGAESTTFASIWDEFGKNKTSYECNSMMPEKVFLNGIVLTSIPADLFVSTILDSLSHCFDTLWNKNKTNNSEFLALQAINLISENLDKFLTNKKDQKVNTNLLRASNIAGQAINVSKTSLSHAISYPLTIKYGLPHGLACGFTLLSITKIYGEKLIDQSLQKKLIQIFELLNANYLKKLYSKYLTSLQPNEVTKQTLKNPRVQNFYYEISEKEILQVIELAKKDYL